MKPMKPKFAVRQMVNKVLPGEAALLVPVSVLERKWAGHMWYYQVAYSDGLTVWLLEVQLRAPIGATV